MRVRRLELRRVVRPMRTVFATSLGRKSAATSVLVKVVLDGGAAGLGEAATSFVLPHETPQAIEAILRQARSELAGMPIEQYPAALEAIRRRHAEFRMTLAGLEVALFRARLAATGQTEHAWWGGATRQIETDITIPFVPDLEALEPWIGRAVRTGFRAYKVKVSGQIERDMPFLAGLRERLSRGVERLSIRLDGNQGFTASSCLALLDRLRRTGLAVELFEQPLARDDWAGLRALRGRCGVPLVLDETVLSAADCRRAIGEGLADGVNIKIAKSGIAESREIYRLAKAAGWKLMAGCMTETIVGLSAGIAMAAGAGGFDYVDLDSVHFLYGRRGRPGLRADGPRYILEGP